MRTLASLHHYLATSDDGGVQIHQYASGRIGNLGISTDYPWHCEISIEVTTTAGEPWALDPTRAGVGRRRAAGGQRRRARAAGAGLRARRGAPGARATASRWSCRSRRG
jgi:hypothetical protein